MIEWVATPVDHVFCPAVNPQDPDGRCHHLAGHSGLHEASDGEDWTDPSPDPRRRRLPPRERWWAAVAASWSPRTGDGVDMPVLERAGAQR